MNEAAPSSAGWGSGASWALRAVGAICVLRAGVLVASGLAGTSIEVSKAHGEHYSSYEAAYLSGSCLYVFAFLAAAPLFLVWLYRARSRQAWFAAAVPSGAAQDISPAGAVAVWFIPALNLFLPYTTIVELFRDEGQRATDQNLHLPLWWGTFIAASILGVITIFGGRLGGGDGISGRMLWIQTLQELSLAISAFLAARFVSEFERRTALRSLESVF